jgi:hypothetical protein
MKKWRVGISGDINGQLELSGGGLRVWRARRDATLFAAARYMTPVSHTPNRGPFTTFLPSTLSRRRSDITKEVVN